jgi:hypothetical protein
MAPSERLELPTSQVEAGRSDPLSYEGVVMEGMEGIEPPTPGFEARCSVP